MKRLLLITVIFLAAIACERHSAAEPPPGTPTPSATAPANNIEKKIDWDEWTAKGTIVLALVSLVVGVWTALLLRQTKRRADEAENVRTMAACIAQYQELENKLQDTVKPMTAKRYFEQLWNLHFAEFHYFKRGFLPEDVYALWVRVRYDDYRKPDLKLGLTEKEGWELAKGYLRDKAFETFVESWLLKPDITDFEITQLLRAARRSTNAALKS